MAIPDWVTFGTESSAGAGSTNAARTPALPSAFSIGQTMLLFVSSDGGIPTLQTANGWALAQDPAGNSASVGIAGETSIAVFWKRATAARTGGGATTETAPIIADPATWGGTCAAFHTNVYSNVRTSDTPFHKIATSTLTTPSTAVSITPVTTTIADCMIMCLASSAANDATFNSWSGAGYASPATSLDSGWNTATGNASSWTGGRGGKATAGAGSAMTTTFGTSTQQARISLALASLPEPGTTGTGAITQADNTASGTATAGMGVGSSTVKQRINAAAPTSGTFTTDPITTATGSVLVCAVMRGQWANAATKPPTDSQGNTWIAVTPGDQPYSGYPGARAGLWYCVNVAGSNAHTFSAAYGAGGSGGGDEVTIAVVELLGVATLASGTHVERAAAASISGSAITPSARSVMLSWALGTGPVGQTHVFNVTGTAVADGWALVAGACATGDPSLNGYIQTSLAALADNAGAKSGVAQNCVFTNPSVNEGAQIFQQAFQLSAGASGDGAIVLAGDSAAGTGSINVSGAAAISLAGDSAAGAGSIDVAGVAAVVLAGDSASGTASQTAGADAAIVLAGDTASGAGSVDVTGAAAIVLDGDAASGTAAGALLTISGDAAIQLAGDTAIGAGTIIAPLVGDAAIQLDDDRARGGDPGPPMWRWGGAVRVVGQRTAGLQRAAGRSATLRIRRA